MQSNNKLTLFEVSQRIQEALDSSFPTRIWVVAEISELKENRSGHCYLELVEKDENSDQPKAKARATIWAGTYRMLKPFFETSTQRRLGPGIKVLVLCDVNYHPLYGFSLNIQDIDPTFTLGDIEQKRQHTINLLIEEGVFDMNKGVGFPLLPKRVAVISSPTAAGFQDFSHQLDNNPRGYVIHYKLYKATMQGEKAEDSIINALNQIYNDIDSWDVVVIIRGGGSQVDLGCFDNYNLATHIAQFPIPIITGIGHEKDITVADMVAHTRQKTPTAVAEYLLDHFNNAENWLIEAIDSFSDTISVLVKDKGNELDRVLSKTIPFALKKTANDRLKLERKMLQNFETINRKISSSKSFLINRIGDIHHHFNSNLYKHNQRITYLIDRIRIEPKKNMVLANDKLNFLAKNLNALNPETILKRGFSITYHNGKVLKSAHNIKNGEKIETHLSNGKIYSIIEEISKELG